MTELREWTGGGRYPQLGESFGRYRIDRRLGHGAMGVVFAATQVDLGRIVALKVLAPGLADAEEYQHRFSREAEALAKVDSPHIVQIFEAGRVEAWQYLVMQYVPGGDLRHLISKGPVELPVALRIVSDVASGLDDAHSVGVLHRDVKPSNILLRPLSKGGYHAYVADLGIAQAIGADVTRTQGIIGSPTYMPPERHDGEDATVQGDIYSLGCVLYATLTGRAPYEGTDVKVAIAHLSNPVPQLEPAPDRPAEVTTALNEILATAMAKDPSERYADMSTLTDALTTALATPPTLPLAPETEVVPASEASATLEATLVRPNVPLSSYEEAALPTGGSRSRIFEPKKGIDTNRNVVRAEVETPIPERSVGRDHSDGFADAFEPRLAARNWYFAGGGIALAVIYVVLAPQEVSDASDFWLGVKFLDFSAPLLIAACVRLLARIPFTGAVAYVASSVALLAQYQWVPNENMLLELFSLVAFELFLLGLWRKGVGGRRWLVGSLVALALAVVVTHVASDTGVPRTASITESILLLAGIPLAGVAASRFSRSPANR